MDVISNDELRLVFVVLYPPTMLDFRLVCKRWYEISRDAFSSIKSFGFVYSCMYPCSKSITTVGYITSLQLMLSSRVYDSDLLKYYLSNADEESKNSILPFKVAVYGDDVELFRYLIDRSGTELEGRSMTLGMTMMIAKSNNRAITEHLLDEARQVEDSLCAATGTTAMMLLLPSVKYNNTMMLSMIGERFDTIIIDDWDKEILLGTPKDNPIVMSLLENILKKSIRPRTSEERNYTTLFKRFLL